MNTNNDFRTKVRTLLRTIADSNISFSGKKEYFHMPLWLFLIIVLATAKISIPLMIVSLFMQCEYIITGRDYCSETKISFRPQA